MPGLAINAGLAPEFPTPPLGSPDPVEQITEEAGILPPPGPDLRVSLLVDEGVAVAQGAPVAELRDTPEIRLVAPMAATVARVALGSGKRLSQIVLFRDASGDRMRHDGLAGTAAEVRSLLQAAGLWPRIARRPFGGMPVAGDRPAAIAVMAADTRPFAPDPVLALAGREEDFARGLGAVALLTDGPVLLCEAATSRLPRDTARVRRVVCGPRHPQGLAGHRIHAEVPAAPDRPVWDIHAEDVADLGALIVSGYLPETRLVQLAGDGLRESGLVRSQPGADLRGLTRPRVQPGAHLLWSGSPLCGRASHWLGPRDRQVTVLPRPEPAPDRHWFLRALTHSALPRPVIPTAALAEAMGGDIPAAALIRALTSGDDEAAMGLGVLSLLEEDLALADYVTGDGAHLRHLLRRMLDRIETEYAA